MRHFSEAELDKIIQETVREMVDSVTPPPLEESWARFEKKFIEQQKTYHKKRRKLLFLRLAASAGVIIFLSGAFAVLFPVKSRAVGEKILSTVENLISPTQMNIRTGYRHNDPLEIPPPPKDGLTEVHIEQERIVSLEEAKTLSPFPVAIPYYIPDGYTIDQVKFQPMIKPVARVSLKYNGPDSKYFVLEEMNVPEGYVQGYGYDIEDAAVKDVKVGNSAGKLILFKNDRIRITWLNQSVLFTLEGKISEDEALKIAGSI